jgi:Ca2+:H+ antiporter
LTAAIEPASERLGLTPIFSGVFLLALVGNAAEIFNAVRFARKDQMDLSLGITMGASTQVALLVGPVLVFAGFFLNQDMNFVFSDFEIVSIGLAVIVVRALTFDGASNWLEGLMLVVLYVMLGFGFYHMRVPH